MDAQARALKDAEEAEKLFQGQFVDATPKPDDKPDDKKIEPDKKPDDKVVEPEPKPDDSKPPEDKTPEPLPTPPPIEDFEHKYKVLKGKYDKEVPDLAHRLTQTVNKLQTLESELNDLRSGKTKDLDKPQKILDSLEQDPDIALLRTEYPEVWKSVSKAIDTVATETQRKIDEISARVEKQTIDVAKTNRDKFYDTLDKEVTGWETINTSPEFDSWLHGKDRYTGLTRYQLLMDAYAQMDATRVQSFFADFAEENKPPEDPPAAPEPTPKVKEPVVGAPRDAGHKKPVDKSTIQPEIIKAADVKSFYEARQKGYFLGREDEMKKEEARIETAIREGRVI